jgi:hypothetical protein
MRLLCACLALRSRMRFARCALALTLAPLLSPRSNARAIDDPDRAAALLRRGCDAHPRDAALLARLGDALTKMRHFSQAVRCYEQALALVGASSGAPPAGGADCEADLQAACAVALYKAGRADAGATLVMRVLRATGEQHRSALLLYGKAI